MSEAIVPAIGHPFDEDARKYAELLKARDDIDRQLLPMNSLIERRLQVESELEKLRGEMPSSLKKKTTERLET